MRGCFLGVVRRDESRLTSWTGVEPIIIEAPPPRGSPMTHLASQSFGQHPQWVSNPAHARGLVTIGVRDWDLEIVRVS